LSYEERITLTDAAARLGVSHTKMWQLVRDGTLRVEHNPLDRREKLVRVTDLVALEERSRVNGDGGRQSGERPRRHFLSDGMANNPSAVRSDRIEEYLREHWQVAGVDADA
jgi:hypothetical protein